MMDPHARDVVVYSLQIGGLTAACAAAAWTIRLPLPSMRFVYWRAVVALCMLLPLWPARVVDVTLARATRSVIATGAPRVVASTPSGTFATAMGHAHAAHTFSWSCVLAPAFAVAAAAKWIPALLVVGVACRLLWLAAGLFSLRRLAATAGDPIVEPDLSLLHRQIAPQAEVRWHPTLAQAVTFGARRPVVLLPAYLSRHPIEIQRAVVCHELLHAARADWLQSLVEQIVVACFWFHPAVWWAIGQIELSREQIVDRLVVAITGSRRSYLQALLAFADRPALSPATAFAGRRQLALRIKQLSEEVVMSRWRFAITTAALAVVMSTSVWAIASAMPLRTEVRYHALPVSDGVAASAALSQQQPAAPAAPAARTDADPDPIRQPARTEPAGAAVDPAQRRAVLAQAAATIERLRAAFDQARVASASAQQTVNNPTYPEQALKYGVGATVSLTATVTVNGDVLDVKTSKWNLPIDRDIQDIGYWTTQPQRAFIDACETVVRQAKVAPRPAEGTAYVTFTFDPGSPRGSIGVRWDYGPSPASAPSAHFSRGVTFSAAPVRVGGNVRAPRPIAHADPIYPQSAIAARIQGVVIIQATIGPDGLVDEAQVLRSVPDLDQAALDAVSQWQYEPVLLNGAAIPVVMTVTVNFSLRQQ